MLKKKERGAGKTDCVLADGLYVRRRDGVFKITSSFRFEEQPKVSVISVRRMFRVIDGVAVPLSGVGAVEIEKSPRVVAVHPGEVF
jgi:hypothetical protein